MLSELAFEHPQSGLFDKDHADERLMGVDRINRTGGRGRSSPPRSGDRNASDGR